MAAAPPSPSLDPGRAGWTARRIGVRFLGLAAAYVALSRLGYYLSFAPAHISPLWPPAGLGLAAVLVWGGSALPGIFLGQLLGTLLQGHGPIVAVLAGLAAAVEAAIAGHVLGRAPGFRRGLHRLSDVVTFAAVGVLAALAGAVIGVLGFWTRHDLAEPALFPSLRLWWIGDALGILLVTPLLLVWLDPVHGAALRGRRGTEWGLALACLGLTALLGLTPAFGSPAIVVPAVMWFALRFGLRGGTLAAGLTAVLAWWSFRAGEGPLNVGGLAHALVNLQVMLGVVCFIALVLGAITVERRATLERLQAALETQRAVVQGSPLAIATYDAEGRIVEWNPAAERMSGWQAEEVIGGAMPGERLGSEADAAAFRAALFQSREGVSYDTVRRRRDGSTIDVRAWVAPLRDADDQVRGVVGIAEDVTERRRTEEALRASEERYRALFDQSPIGVFLYDRTLHLTECNAAFVRLVRATREQALGFDLVALRDGRAVPALRAVLEGASSEYEGPYRPATGPELMVRVRLAPLRDAEGGVVGGIGLLEDITERKQAEAAIRAGEERFAALAQATNDAVYDWNVVEDRTWWGVGITLFGYEEGDFADDPYAWTRRVHPDDLAGVQASQRAALAGRARVWRREYRFRRADGTYAEVAERGFILRDERGRAVRVIGALSDLTERREAEAALRRTEDQLRQAQKMEAVGRLAGGIAHDFNNLLTTLLGISDLVLAELAADDPHRADLEEIRAAGQRAAGLTRQLLAFSRKQVIAPAIVDLNELVGGLAGMLERLLGERVTLVTRRDPALGPVRADPGQLEQVVVNLAVNARDAMPEGGTLTIATENVEVGAETIVRESADLPPGPYVRLTVSDTGTGMDAETQARIFEPFFTTKPVGKGTGLGLATVYGIVRQSGGAVTVWSRPGEGSRFGVYLPRVEAATGEPLPGMEPRAADAGPGGPGGTETILLVEDETSVRELARRVLTARGYTVLAAEDADAALQLARTHPGPIDLLLSDVVMPGRTGPQLAEELVAERPTTRVLFVSGYTDTALARTGELAPDIGFVQKPFLPEVLARSVREALDANPAPPSAAAP